MGSRYLSVEGVPEVSSLESERLSLTKKLSKRDWKKMDFGFLLEHHHKFTEDELRAMEKYESEDSRRVQNKVYQTYLRSHKHRSDTFKWIMFAIIGLVTGLVWTVIKQSSDWLLVTRIQKEMELLSKGQSTLAYIVHLLFSEFFILVAALLCVFVQPVAAGGGVADVIGYLNGVHLPQIFNIKTMYVKFIVSICAVASALPTGIEGSMIQLGAAIGGGLSQGRSKTLGLEGIGARFRNPQDKREFICGGTAAGLAASFNAPIGGMLFTLEEAGSFFTYRLAWMIVFCAMFGNFVTNMFDAAFHGWTTLGPFGYFENSGVSLYSVGFDVNLSIFTLPFVAVTAILAGLLGALYNFLNIKFLRWRANFINHSRILKVLEPLVVVGMFATLAWFVPFGFACKPLLADPALSSIANSTDLAQFQCASGDFNPMASLLYNKGDHAVRGLIARGSPDLYNYGHLFTFLIIYFLFASYVNGMSIGSGLMLTPMMVIGATVGRIVGLIVFHVVNLILYHSAEGNGMADNTIQWNDPAIYAMVGAAAFFAGVSRLSICLTIIMVELADSLQLLLPLTLSILLGKWVAEHLTSSLYHTILEVKCVPFLENEIQHDKLDAYSVGDVMASPVVTIKEVTQVRDIFEALSLTAHNTFPIVDPDTMKYKGTMQRSLLLLMLYNEHLFVDDPTEVEHADLLPLDYLALEEAYHTANSERPVPQLTEAEKDKYLDLGPYVNTSATAIQYKYSLGNTYMLFRQLFLRCAVVLNESNDVIGIVTRKDLLAQTVQDKLMILQAKWKLGHESSFNTFVD